MQRSRNTTKYLRNETFVSVDKGEHLKARFDSLTQDKLDHRGSDEERPKTKLPDGQNPSQQQLVMNS